MPKSLEFVEKAEKIRDFTNEKLEKDLLHCKKRCLEELGDEG